MFECGVPKRELGETLAVTPRGLLMWKDQIMGTKCSSTAKAESDGGLLVCKGELGQEAQLQSIYKLETLNGRGAFILHIALLYAV